jgi:RNA polymerase sporulation-specific sigma factor
MSTSPSEKNVHIEDNELVLRINAGEYELFHILIKRYQPYINGTALSLSSAKSEVEDLVQEGNIALFSAVRGFSQGSASFKTFATVCIKNAMIDVLRKQTAKHKIPEALCASLEDVEPQDDNTPEKIFFDNESYRLLKDSINVELSKLEHKVLSAHLAGMSYSDIAEFLDVTVKSVDNSLKRVRGKLKNLNIQ